MQQLSPVQRPQRLSPVQRSLVGTVLAGAAQAVSGFVVFPLYARSLGDSYGVVLTIVSVCLVAQGFDLGAGQAVLRRSAHLGSSSLLADWSCRRLWLRALVAATVAAVAGLLILRVGAIGPQVGLGTLVVAVVLGILVPIALRPAQGAMHGVMQYGRERSYLVLAALVRVLGAILVYNGFLPADLWLILLLELVTFFVAPVAATIRVVSLSDMVDLRSSPSNEKHDRVSHAVLVRFAWSALLIGSVTAVVSYAETAVVGMAAGVESVVVFAAAVRFFQICRQGGQWIAEPISAKATSAFFDGQTAGVAILHRRINRSAVNILYSGTYLAGLVATLLMPLLLGPLRMTAWPEGRLIAGALLAGFCVTVTHLMLQAHVTAAGSPSGMLYPQALSALGRLTLIGLFAARGELLLGVLCALVLTTMLEPWFIVRGLRLLGLPTQQTWHDWMWSVIAGGGVLAASALSSASIAWSAGAFFLGALLWFGAAIKSRREAT